MAQAPRLFTGAIPSDLFHLMCGDRIGQGIAREVYIFKPDPSKVIKFELGTHDFQNVAEWELWQNAPESAAKWLAPVISISDYGHILIQARVDPLLSPPPRIPQWLGDVKADNWGTYDGRPVAVDYGRHRMFSHGFHTLRKLVPTRGRLNDD